MSEMIERVGRAIHHTDAVATQAIFGGVTAWEDDSGRHPAYLAMARAAIEAMREPTDAMVRTHSAYGSDEQYFCGEDWRAMIDEALKPDVAPIPPPTTTP